MPELPEVETTRRGLLPHVGKQRISRLSLYERRLRWPVERCLPENVTGLRICAVIRRAKYLLFELEHQQWLLVHLGMSGSLRVVTPDTPRLKHDHFEIELESGLLLRFNDPRRFGSLHRLEGDPNQHPLLAELGPEPLSVAFDADYLWSRLRKRRVAIKSLIMNANIVVGVGNIYASEALFLAGVRPTRQARGLNRTECLRLTQAIKTVLQQAIDVGGTTLRDFVGADGKPGYFRQQLNVYERADEPCRTCGSLIRSKVLGQRATYWCSQCQC
jgi:formamidopyrimidine-DNA glycosylase